MPPRRSVRVIPEQKISVPAITTSAQRRQSTRRAARGEVSDANENPKSTSKKSKYFTEESSNSESDVLGDIEVDSAYEDTRDAPDPESDHHDGSDFGEEQGLHDREQRQEAVEEPPKANKRRGWGWAAGRKRKTRDDDDGSDAEPSTTKGRLLWEEGVTTGLGPGKEVFIKLPKAREAGNTPYTDGELHPNTMLFLKDLKQNNKREWLKSECKNV